MNPFVRALCVLIFASVPVLAAAQGTGTISGTVADETGGVLPGTSVVLRRQGAIDQETVTNELGV